MLHVVYMLTVVLRNESRWM